MRGVVAPRTVVANHCGMAGRTNTPRAVLLAFALTATAPANAREAPLQQRVEAKLHEAGPGTRFGLVVATEDGRELVAIAPDDRFTLLRSVKQRQGLPSARNLTPAPILTAWAGGADC